MLTSEHNIKSVQRQSHSGGDGLKFFLAKHPRLLEDPVETLEITRQIIKGFNPRDREGFNKDFLKILQQNVNTNANPFDVSTCFLLHGALLPDPASSIKKITHNARVLKTSRYIAEHFSNFIFAVEFKDTFLHQAKSIHQALNQRALRLTVGVGQYADIAGGLVLRLYSDKAAHPKEFIAQASIYFDSHNHVAYLFNLQGCHSREFMFESSANFQGKQYARWQHLLAESPRVKIAKIAQEICSFLDYKVLKAVRPCSHPYSYISHPGFRGNYEQDLITAGFSKRDKKEPKTYLSLKLS